MNKKRVNDMLLTAKEALKDCEIVDRNDKIDATFRNQISSFGAAVVMGSLPAAVAFFSAKNNSSTDRQNLMKAIYYCIKVFESPIEQKATAKKEASGKTARDVLEYVCRNYSYELKEKVIDASIAIKLAMNFYELDPKGKENEKSESDIQ